MNSLSIWFVALYSMVLTRVISEECAFVESAIGHVRMGVMYPLYVCNDAVEDMLESSYQFKCNANRTGVLVYFYNETSCDKNKTDTLVDVVPYEVVVNTTDPYRFSCGNKANGETEQESCYTSVTTSLAENSDDGSAETCQAIPDHSIDASFVVNHCNGVDLDASDDSEEYTLLTTCDETDGVSFHLYANDACAGDPFTSKTYRDGCNDIYSSSGNSNENSPINQLIRAEIRRYGLIFRARLGNDTNALNDTIYVEMNSCMGSGGGDDDDGNGSNGGGGSNGPSSGAVIGIVVAALILTIVLGVLSYCVYLRRKQKKEVSNYQFL